MFPSLFFFSLVILLVLCGEMDGIKLFSTSKSFLTEQFQEPKSILKDQSVKDEKIPIDLAKVVITQEEILHQSKRLPVYTKKPAIKGFHKK